MSDSTERNCDKCIHHTSGNCDSWDCKMQTVEDVKKEAVNEYVKVVVEELEEMKTIKGSMKTVTCRKWDYGTVNRAIEIVKQGCVSDDVCEWKIEDEEANLYLTGCQQRQLIFEGTPKENGYRYCPYCSKKIKVVE